MPNPGRPELPFRAVWLALQAHGLVPTYPPAKDQALWSAYTSLPPARRLAVWHREVEGQRPGEIGRHLALSEHETARLLAASYGELRRTVAMAYGATATCPEALDLVEGYRFGPLSRRPDPDVQELHLAGRHCGECDELTRLLIRVDDNLRVTLAEVVLGPRAVAYLARRPRVAPLPAPGAASDTDERRLRPGPAILWIAGVAAAAMVLVVINPSGLSGPGGDRVSSADTPIAGTLLQRLPPASPRPAAQKSSPAPREVARATDGGQSGSTATGSGDTVTGNSGATPQTSSSGHGGSGGPNSPGQPPANDPPPADDPGPVDVQVTPGGATVTVHTHATGPVVIKVPLHAPFGVRHPGQPPRNHTGPAGHHAAHAGASGHHAAHARPTGHRRSHRP